MLQLSHRRDTLHHSAARKNGHGDQIGDESSLYIRIRITHARGWLMADAFTAQ